MKTLVAGALLTCAVALAPTAQTCPTYMHRDDVSFGTDRTTLPDGFFVYKRQSMMLYKSSLRAYAPVEIPNSSDAGDELDLSDDGRWLVYETDNGFTMMRVDGTGKVVVPALGSQDAGRNLEFYHGSPYNSATSLELFCVSSRDSAIAILVDVSGTRPVFGRTRTVIQLKGSVAWFAEEGRCTYSIWGNRFYGRLSEPGMRAAYITIPDGGRGTATYANVYKWAGDDPSADLFGCGYAVSRDGSLALANSCRIGSTCVPNCRNGMDHKGFYITRWLENSVAAPIRIDECIDNPAYGVSINWAPEPFRTGDFIVADCRSWSWATGTNEYVIGTVKGGAIAARYYGTYLIHVATNTWYHLTPGLNCYSYRPRFHINGTVGVGQSRPAPRGAGARTITAVVPTRDQEFGRHARAFTIRGQQLTGTSAPSVYFVNQPKFSGGVR